MTDTPRPRPHRPSGLARLIEAGRNSRSGLRRLWGEAAFRTELVGGAAVIGVLIAVEASADDYATFAMLFFILIAVEALNTAIEAITDHLAPNWQEFARDAKDLGSLAVFCLLVAHGVFLAHVLLR